MPTSPTTPPDPPNQTIKETSEVEKFLTKAMTSVGFVVLLFVLGVPSALVSALPVMLALGVLHHDVTTAVPALGYWAVVVLLWGLAVAVAYLRPYRPQS
jgi:hypothetical protein